jgi:hypothetical protein
MGSPVINNLLRAIDKMSRPGRDRRNFRQI